MSTIRVPPMGVRSTTNPGGSLRISPIRAASRPSGWDRRAARADVDLIGRDDGHEFAFVGDVERVYAEQLARGADRRPYG